MIASGGDQEDVPDAFGRVSCSGVEASADDAYCGLIFEDSADVGGVEWFVVVVALAEVAAEVFEGGGLFLGFDAFGEGVEVEGFAEAKDCAYEGGVVAAV